MLSMTPFVRILVIFHFLRQALGTQSTPANQTLIGLVSVADVLSDAAGGRGHPTQALVPLGAGRITPWPRSTGLARSMRDFMLRYTREKDLALFVELAPAAAPAAPEDLPMRIVIPAYILSS